MPGPTPVTLNPIPTTAAWDASRFTVSYIGRINTPGIDAATGLPIAHIQFSGFGDLNGDGWPEIVISGWSFRSGFGSTPGTPPTVPITIFSTSAAGATQLSAASLLGVAASAGTTLIRVADFNGDGRNDLFIGGHNESPFTPSPSTLFTWTPAGFTSRTTSFLTTSHEGYNGDFNGDGFMDVVASAYQSSGPFPAIWMTGNSFGTTWFQSTADRPVLILNLGDGQGGFRSFPIAFDRPNADLAQVDANTFGNWSGGSASAFADFDNDGRSEIVVVDMRTRANFTNGQSYIISNIQFESNSAYGTLTSLPLPYFDRDSTYRGATSFFEPDKSHDVQVLIFDYNNDGLIDILINTLLWNPGDADGGQDYSVTQVLRNDGGLRFTDVTDDVFYNAYLGKGDPGHDSILVDVNGDGFLDLISNSEPDYANGQVRPNSQSNEVFINTGDGKFVSVMWSQFDGLTAATTSLLLSQGVGRGSFQGAGDQFFPYVRPDGGLSFITVEDVQRGDGTIDQYYFNITPNQPFSTGPGGNNPASMGAAGFNEAYYLTTYASVASAVQAGQYANGLAHYLAIGRAAGFNGFAKNAQVQGTEANDVITLREGNEKAFGLGGDDIMQGGLGDDTLDGGSGFDTADYATAGSGVTVDLGMATAQNTGGAGRDTLVSIEGVVGSDFADVLIGSAVANALVAGAGNDVLRGNGGNDTLDGGAGFDAALYSGVRRQYVASSTSVSGNGEGTDNLTGIEEVRFVDGVLTFDATSASAQVMRLYSATLNRAPDQGGLEFNVGRLASIGLQQLADTFVASSEFQARFGALNNQQFVEQLFVFALGRAGDAGGIAFWTSQLNGGASRGQIVVGFSESAENQSRTAATLNAGLWVPDQQALIVARLYDATFKRLPDVGGLEGWTNALKGGTSATDIAAAFASSGEFQATFGALSNQAFVEQLFRFCLNREGDPGGISFWVNTLNAGTSRASVLLGFSESAEHVALTAPLWSGGIRFAGFASAPVEDQPVKGLAGEPQVLIPADEDAPQVLDLAATGTSTTKINGQIQINPGIFSYDPADIVVGFKLIDDAFVLPPQDELEPLVLPEANLLDIVALERVSQPPLTGNRMLTLPTNEDGTPDDATPWHRGNDTDGWMMH